MMNDHSDKPPEVTTDNKAQETPQNSPQDQTPQNQEPINEEMAKREKKIKDIKDKLESVLNAKEDDFYAILGVDRNADIKEIRKAYLDSIGLVHTDKAGLYGGNIEAHEKASKLVGAAYKMLSEQANYNVSYDKSKTATSASQAKDVPQDAKYTPRNDYTPPPGTGGWNQMPPGYEDENLKSKNKQKNKSHGPSAVEEFEMWQREQESKRRAGNVPLKDQELFKQYGPKENEAPRVPLKDQPLYQQYSTKHKQTSEQPSNVSTANTVSPEKTTFRINFSSVISYMNNTLKELQGHRKGNSKQDISAFNAVKHDYFRAMNIVDQLKIKPRQNVNAMKNDAINTIATKLSNIVDNVKQQVKSPSVAKKFDELKMALDNKIKSPAKQAVNQQKQQNEEAQQTAHLRVNH